MNLQERLAWLHHAATTLPTDDMVALKFQLKDLISQAEAARDIVRAELQAQRTKRAKDDRQNA